MPIATLPGGMEGEEGEEEESIGEEEMVESEGWKVKEKSWSFKKNYYYFLVRSVFCKLSICCCFFFEFADEVIIFMRLQAFSKGEAKRVHTGRNISAHTSNLLRRIVSNPTVLRNAYLKTELPIPLPRPSRLLPLFDGPREPY